MGFAGVASGGSAPVRGLPRSPRRPIRPPPHRSRALQPRTRLSRPPPQRPTLLPAATRIRTVNPSTLNPSTLNPSTLNPGTLNPKTVNP